MPQATYDVQQLNQAIQAAMRSIGGGGGSSGAQFGAGSQSGGGAQFGGFGGQTAGFGAQPGFGRMGGDSGWEQQIEDVLRDFPDLTVVLAHGGRGWWYEAAAFLALMRPNVWIEISGLPPRRLPDYYQSAGFARVARKMIFGTDWPAVPGIAAPACDL